MIKNQERISSIWWSWWFWYGVDWMVMIACWWLMMLMIYHQHEKVFIISSLHGHYIKIIKITTAPTSLYICWWSWSDYMTNTFSTGPHVFQIVHWNMANSEKTTRTYLVGVKLFALLYTYKCKYCKKMMMVMSCGYHVGIMFLMGIMYFLGVMWSPLMIIDCTFLTISLVSPSPLLPL